MATFQGKTLHLPDPGGSDLVLESTIKVLWGKRFDTREIARLLNVREAEVFNRMTVMRVEGRL